MKQGNKKKLKLSLDEALSKKYIDKNGNEREGAEVVAEYLIAEAMKGNIKAFEIIRDTIGEKPPEKIVSDEIPQEVIDEVEGIIAEVEKEK